MGYWQALNICFEVSNQQTIADNSPCMVLVKYHVWVIEYFVRNDLNWTVTHFLVTNYVSSTIRSALSVLASVPMLTGTPAAAPAIDTWVNWSDCFIHKTIMVTLWVIGKPYLYVAIITLFLPEVLAIRFSPSKLHSTTSVSTHSPRLRPDWSALRLWTSPSL